MKLLMVLLASVALVASATPAGGVAGFGDVESGRFFTTPVQWMVDNDITTGTSRACFSPDDSVTRGQAAAFLWRMEGFPEGAPPHPFVDVFAPWQQKPVSWMADEGITTGTTATTYSPDDTLTRGQMAALVWRAAGEPAGAPPHPFVDVFAPWQQDPVSWMADEGITTGTSPTTFSPDDPVTRGQFAAFSYRWKGEPAVVLDDASPLCLGIDNFNGPLAQGWEWVLRVDEDARGAALDDDPTKYNFTTMPGYLTVSGGGDGPEFGPRTLLRDPVSDDYQIETKVSIAPTAAIQQAGLIVRPDEAVAPDTQHSFAIVRAQCESPVCGGASVDDGIYMINNIDGSEPDIASVKLAPGTGDVWLRIRHEGGTYTASYSTDGTTWTEVGSRARVFDTPQYGIATGESALAVVADFDYFMETPL